MLASNAVGTVLALARVLELDRERIEFALEHRANPYEQPLARLARVRVERSARLFDRNDEGRPIEGRAVAPTALPGGEARPDVVLVFASTRELVVGRIAAGQRAVHDGDLHGEQAVERLDQRVQPALQIGAGGRSEEFAEGFVDQRVVALQDLQEQWLVRRIGARTTAVRRARDLGVDAMHINLHKTFSTPHGGGGPGSGPVVLSKRLAAYAPVPFLRGDELVEQAADAQGDEKPFGRLTAFHGQMGMYVRALSYMLSHGADGCCQASEDAVLNANYIRAGLRDLLSQPFGDKPCMHEALFDDTWLKDTGISTLDIAKAMIDEGYHPMTMYFPLVVHGAMLIEPTESESKASLDLFIAMMRDLAMAVKAGDTARFSQAPYHAPRRRLDETRAARVPVLKWTPLEKVMA